jgi:hypothetical protein
VTSNITEDTPPTSATKFSDSPSSAARDLSPDHKRFGAGSPVLGGGEVIAAEVEEVVDLIMSREEALHLTS